jgi:hypothetical protein
MQKMEEIYIQEWKKIFFNLWLSTVIREDAFIWGDQSTDGRPKSVLKIKGNKK